MNFWFFGVSGGGWIGGLGVVFGVGWGGLGVQ